MAVRPRRVHAVARAHVGVVRNEVGRGHAELAAALVAVHHLALEKERLAEELRGLRDLTRGHEAADVARGDGLAGRLHERHHSRLEAVVRAEELGRAARPLSEAEVLAHRHLPGTEPVEQHVLHEVLGAAPGELLVERDHHELVHAEPGDQVALHREGADQLRRGLRMDHRQRVRVEGEHGVGAADHLAMAAVYTVERPDRDAARPRARLDVVE
jgi:hypothetical protein